MKEEPFSGVTLAKFYKNCRWGGDSLQGRYFFHHLHPFTLGELVGGPQGKFADAAKNIPPISKSHQDTLQQLLQFGGFPEPFLSRSETDAARWRNQYGTILVREDVRDLEKTEDLDSMELLYDRLASCVGAPLSINNLREDLGLAHATVAKWISIFENLFGVFRVPPFGPPKIKAVKKESKLYFWDWSRVEAPGARFENLVAVHLLRYCHWLTDILGKKAELRFMRAKTGQEVDFLVLVQQQPFLAVECKSSDGVLVPGFKYFLERIQVPHTFQISLSGGKDYEVILENKTKVRLLPAAAFLAALP